MKRIAKIQVPREAEGQTLLDLLATRFTYHSPAEWQALIGEGRIRFDGVSVPADTRLRSGLTLEYLVPELPEPPVDLDCRILYEDADLLVVDKPGNLPCHPAGRFFRHTLWGVLRERFPDEVFHFVNRLDRETSGLVLLARNPEACRLCADQFMAGTVRKRYQAIVEGVFPEAVEAVGRLEWDERSAVRKKWRFVSEPPPTDPETAPAACAGESRRAHTVFRRAGTHDGLSLLWVELKTGKAHQIRATLLALGFPLVGDKLYGVDETIFLRFIRSAMTDDDRRRLRLERQALHAAELAFRHPRTGAALQFAAPLPADMSQASGAFSQPSHASSTISPV